MTLEQYKIIAQVLGPRAAKFIEELEGVGFGIIDHKVMLDEYRRGVLHKNNMVIVPAEPTQKQIKAGVNVYHKTHMSSGSQIASIYKAMVKKHD